MYTHVIRKHPTRPVFKGNNNVSSILTNGGSLLFGVQVSTESMGVCDLQLCHQNRSSRKEALSSVLVVGACKLSLLSAVLTIYCPDHLPYHHCPDYYTVPSLY